MAEVSELGTRLLRWAARLPGMEEAVQLLLATPWPADAEFVGRCVVEVDGDPPLALVDWAATGDFLEGCAERGADAAAVATLERACLLAGRVWGERADHPALRRMPQDPWQS